MAKVNTETNGYTFLFASAMVVVVAATLAFTASSLKEKQDVNIRQEKMQNILSTIGIETTRPEAEILYDQYIIEQISLDGNGDIDQDIDAFTLDLAIETKKSITEQRFPLFKGVVNGEKYYIIPLRGSGLWDAIWGYIALKEDRKTLKGAVFDHAAETAGLGAEITQPWFMKQFDDEVLFDDNHEFVGIKLTKTNNDPGNTDKFDFEVDAISGATITGDGISDMIIERMQHYLPYFAKLNE